MWNERAVPEGCTWLFGVGVADDSSGVFPVSTQGEGVAEHFSGSGNNPGELVRDFLNCHYLVSFYKFLCVWF